MRLIHVKNLKEGDIIGRDILNDTGSILLRRMSIFKEAYRERLLERQIEYVYIDDEISKGIEPTEVISLEVRQRIERDITNEFDKIKNRLNINYEVLSQVTSLLMQQLSSKEIFFEMNDLKTNHSDTYNHCIGVALMSTLVCRKMGIGQEMTEKIVLGALIHDIGKVIIPKDILDKPSALTNEEYELIKSHAFIGYDMIKDNVELSPITKIAVLCHHEREDGTGYPLGKGDDVHIGVKIVATCDVFHALLSDRSYRKGLPVNRAIMIAKGEKLDPRVRSIVESILAFYPIGCTVLLNTGELAVVETNYVEDLERPLVRVYNHPQVGQIKPYKLDLRENKNIHVVDKL